jgi:hypothetical protein
MIWPIRIEIVTTQNASFAEERTPCENIASHVFVIMACVDKDKVVALIDKHHSGLH